MAAHLTQLQKLVRDLRVGSAAVIKRLATF